MGQHPPPQRLPPPARRLLQVKPRLLPVQPNQWVVSLTVIIGTAMVQPRPVQKLLQGQRPLKLEVPVF